MVCCIIHFIENPKIFQQTWSDLEINGNFVVDFYFGFCSALLGISGFESAANFIEEQVSLSLCLSVFLLNGPPTSFSLPLSLPLVLTPFALRFLVFSQNV